MLTTLLIMLAVSVLIVLMVAVVIWLDVAFRRGQVQTDREKTVHRWQPPFARGNDLLNWAKDTAARIAGKRLVGKRTADTARELSAELHDGAIRAMLPLVPDRETERMVACPDGGQGAIGVMAPEVLEIADYIRHKLSRRERNRIHGLAQKNAERLADREHAQFDADELPCPLQNDNGVCRVYAARPLQCRPLHAAKIARQFGMETSGADGEIPPWPAHVLLIEDGVKEGLVRELESAGLDANVYELNGALVTALDTPHAAQRWARGEDVFAGCQRYR